MMDSALKAHFKTLARYNQWATRKLFESVDALPDELYRRDVGLFFKSVHGTLNHLLVGEHLLWFARFSEGASPRMALDTEAEPDRTRLRKRLLEGAARWHPLVSGFAAGRFDGRLDYLSSQGVFQSLPFTPALAHVFNHGTHHRGQISAALTALGQPCPEIDLVWMLQQESAASSA